MRVGAISSFGRLIPETVNMQRDTPKCPYCLGVRISGPYQEKKGLNAHIPSIENGTPFTFGAVALMAGTLDSRSSGPSSGPGSAGGHCFVCSWTKRFILIVPFFTQVYE